MAGASASTAISGGPRRTSKRSETVCTVVVEPAAASSALRHADAHTMETTPSPVAVAVAVAAALQLRLGSGGGGGSKGVPFPPPDPPRASVLVLFPWRRRHARLPDGVRPLNAAKKQELTGSGYIYIEDESSHHKNFSLHARWP